jgi:hypothetical protein
MRTMYLEDPIRAEVRMKHEEFAREQEMEKLARIATQNRPTAVGKTWASVATELDRLAKRGSHAIRSVLAGPSEPSEQCC